MAVLSAKRHAERSRPFPAGLAYTALAAYRWGSSSMVLIREERAPMAAQAIQTLASAPHVALRGTYDTTGYRADVDLLVWLAAPEPDALQGGLAAFRQTPLGSMLLPVWSAIGVHRQADTGKSGVPAYFQGESACRYASVCEINYTPEWHALSTADRRRLQGDGDRTFRRHGEVLVSSVGAAGLGGCESLLALESNELSHLVELVRDLSATASHRYVTLPLSFITGVRKPLAEIVGALP